MRFPSIPQEQWSDAQRHVAREIASGPRGELRGPFLALIYSPELASRVQKLGEYLRFESSFSHGLTELAVLMTARHHDCANIWHSHRALAVKAELDCAIIAEIADRRRPARMTQEESEVYSFCDELLKQGRVGDPAFDRVAARWGERGAADLVVLVGYYVTLCYVYNVSQFPLPDGAIQFQP